jgi:hypothetical protein
MTTPKDGGPAFPINGHIGSDGNFIELPTQGMTLRDYFAGQALAGMLADPSVGTTEQTAECAYDMADAMLAAREKGAQ